MNRHALRGGLLRRLAAPVLLVLACVGPAAGAMPLAEAAADSTRPRPSIGLVLGGGGARGVAHVGVLRVLDELRIPVDYVGGTSMGSIIAALFALGMTADEIQQQIEVVDWDDLFADTPDRSRRTYRRKEDDHAFFLPVELGFSKGTLVTNRGIIAGQKLSFAFPNPQIYTAGYRGFDRLAYPLRTVATDLHTGEMVVIDRGNLVQAVRASMSIPGLFPPVRWEGRELIDGGVVRNLPVDVVRAMGADIIIAVDVGTLPEETTDQSLGSFAGVLAQTLTIQGRLGVLSQMRDADVVIQVELEGISFRDFKRVGETIPLGEATARALADTLAPFALSEQDYLAHKRAHRLPSRQQPVIDAVVLRNATPADDRAIRRRIGQRPGEPLDLERLKDDLADIYDLGVAELVDFAVTETDSQNVLTVTASPKLYAPHVFRIGLSYVGGQHDKSHVAMRLRHTWLEMNRFGGEWRNDVQFGRIVGLNSELYQPLTWSRGPFVAVGSWWRNGNYDWWRDGVDAGDFDVIEHASGGGLGSRLAHWGEVRAGVRAGHVKVRSPGGRGPAEFDGHIGGYTGRLAWDTQDHAVFARGGLAGEIDFFAARRTFDSALEYEKLEGRATATVSQGPSSFSLTVSGGSGLATDLPDFELFRLGGLDRLSGYHDDQVRGHTYGIASLRWYRRLYKSPSILPTTLYAGLGLDAGNAWATRRDARLDDLRYGGNISLMVDTYLGPAVLAYGRAEDGNDAVYLTLGSRVGVFE